MNKEQFMIEEITSDMVMWLTEEEGMDVKDALRSVYNSDTYDRLQNLRTGLYTQSSPYVYEYLQNEMKTGRMG